jgi:hypothetical protein
MTMVLSGGVRVEMRGVTVTVPWPRHPRLTSTGAESRSRRAGHLVPWLSMNTVKRTPRNMHMALMRPWREAARTAAELQCFAEEEITTEQLLIATLVKATRQEMDPLAIVEGVKPLVDGIAAGSGLLANDRLVVGAIGMWEKAPSRDGCCVVLQFVPAPSTRPWIDLP